MSTTNGSLNISEIFYSFQGESTLMGRPTTFIRFGGCNLNCKICDTKYVFDNFKKITIDEILKIISHLSSPYVCITGGEPLIQGESLNILIGKLLKLSKIVSLETNGSMLLNDIDDKVKKIIDVKTPSTGEDRSFNLENLKQISSCDELKFVISDHKDFKFSLDFINTHKLYELNIPILFSPNLEIVGLSEKLNQWILKDNIDVIFQPQLHKLVPEEPIYLLNQ